MVQEAVTDTGLPVPANRKTNPSPSALLSDVCNGTCSTLTPPSAKTKVDVGSNWGHNLQQIAAFDRDNSFYRKLGGGGGVICVLVLLGGGKWESPLSMPLFELWPLFWRQHANHYYVFRHQVWIFGIREQYDWPLSRASPQTFDCCRGR